LLLDAELEADRTEAVLAVRIARDGLVLPVLKATADEAAAHDAFLARIRQQCGGETVWDRIGAAASAAAASESTSPLDAPQKPAAGASAASDGRAAALGQSGEPALVPAERAESRPAEAAGHGGRRCWRSVIRLWAGAC